MVAESLTRDELPRPDSDDHTHPNELVHVRVGFHEKALRARIKAAGGTWVPPRHAWELRYDAALDLELRERIIDDGDVDR